MIVKLIIVISVVILFTFLYKLFKKEMNDTVFLMNDFYNKARDLDIYVLSEEFHDSLIQVDPSFLINDKEDLNIFEELTKTEKGKFLLNEYSIVYYEYHKMHSLKRVNHDELLNLIIWNDDPNTREKLFKMLK